MTILNKKILNKALYLIKQAQFDRQWDDLFESGEQQCFDLFHDLYESAKKDAKIKNLIIKNERYIPTILLSALKINI